MPRLRNQGGDLYRGSLLYHELLEVRQYHEAEWKQQVPSRNSAAVGSQQGPGGAGYCEMPACPLRRCTVVSIHHVEFII